jgi:hypothetical protein
MVGVLEMIEFGNFALVFALYREHLYFGISLGKAIDGLDGEDVKIYGIGLALGAGIIVFGYKT